MAISNPGIDQTTESATLGSTNARLGFPSGLPTPNAAAGDPNASGVGRQHSDPQQVAIVDKEWQEFLEQHITSHQELIQAAIATMGAQAQIKTKSAIHTWEDLWVLIRCMGYDLTGGDVWYHFGFGRGEGRMPTIQLLDQRLRFVKRLLQVADASTWQAEDMGKVKWAMDGFTSSFKTCLKELKTIAKSRSKAAPHNIPMWQELGGKLLTYIQERFAQARVALQLSAVLGEQRTT